VTSFANDLLMPPLGLAIGKNLNNWYYVIRPPPYCNPANATSETLMGCDNYVDPNNPNVTGWNVWATPAAAVAAGAVTVNPGIFCQDIINFIVICAALFLFLKVILTMRLNAEKLALKAKAKVIREEKVRGQVVKSD
jgi:large-conductance mechanosensitive channel